MSYQLKLDELQEAMALANHPQAKAFETALCSIGNAMALALSEALSIDCGEASQEGKAFAGICCPLLPRYRHQPLPAILRQWEFDSAEEWEEAAKDESLPPMPDDLIGARIAELEAERDEHISGAPDGSETPDPEGWRRFNPGMAEELDELEAIAAGQPL